MLALQIAALLPLACTGLTPVSEHAILEPLATIAARPPTSADIAAASLAEAAFVSGDAEMAAALSALRAALSARAAKAEQLREEGERSKLLPLALDLVNATEEDPIAYREASAKLLRRGDLDPAQRERLERAVRDDPLRLAGERDQDHWERLFARTFNAVAKPIGTSLFSGLVLAPYKITTSAAHWLAGLFEGERMSVQERQALAHRKRFLARNPDASAAVAVAQQVEAGNEELQQTLRDRNVAQARRAMEADRPRLALQFVERALGALPGDAEASSIRGEALKRIERLKTLRAASCEASSQPPRDLSLAAASRRLIEALLVQGADLVPAARALREIDPSGGFADEVEFVLALAQYESGAESESWRRLEALAAQDPMRSNMARHAAVLAGSSWQNPYGTFLDLLSQGRGKRVAHEVLGPWAAGPRYRTPPRWLAYLIDAPSLAQTAATSPFRFLLNSFRAKPDFHRSTAIAAYRYLDRHPSGEHTAELIAWLFDYEQGRENWGAALRLADFQPDLDAARRVELSEQAAAQELAAAERQSRRDLRGSILRDVVRDFPDSEAGRMAGVAARAEVLGASAQRVRMTRGFLEENPAVAGPRGLGMRDALLDGQNRNGELHPKGVTFLGGRTLEFNLLAESGDEDDPPVVVRREVSAERLARCVTLLDETALRNARIDPDDELGADARRDQFFERARLSLTGDPDVRATAESAYVFQGVRERYGLVRGRESILPFDLVVQGSLADLSLGAYPRWRLPKETPDAFLYR